MDKMDGLSLDLEKENINKIKELFPEAVEEGKINFDMLRAFLGDEVDDSREKYQFTWNGKAKSIKLAQTPSSATLRPCKEKSKNWDTTENLYIEGDNLEVLKQLQKTYYGKIKMIYIDPPYNTGNDFVYNDSFSNSIENYKEQTSQTSSSNPETNGRFHTDWLNMMYPRLILAKNLLSDDGVIFISIDDNEEDNLKKICNEVFGEQNYVSNLVWQKNFAPKNDNKYISNSTEYILVYSKNKNNFKRGLLPREEKHNKGYANPDNDSRGLWTSGSMLATTYSASGVFEILAPNGITHTPPSGRCWRFSREKIKELMKDNRIWWGQKGDGVPRIKRFLSEMPDGIVPQNLMLYTEVGSNQDGNLEMKELFDAQIFDYPKNTKLMERLLRIANVDSGDIVLDFFSGSATIAHTIIKNNCCLNKKIKYILVQLPEKYEDKSGKYSFDTICDIGEERIRRAGEQIKAEWEKEHPNDGLFASEETFNTDIGFKVFKLDSTNLIPWDNSEKYNEFNLYNLNNIFKEDRNNEDVLYEIMLKYGVFDKQVEEIEVNGKTMYRVGKRYMIVCLDNSVTSDDIKAIGELSPRTVIFKESGFIDDNAKINAVYNLEKASIEDVKCI